MNTKFFRIFIPTLLFAPKLAPKIQPFHAKVQRSNLTIQNMILARLKNQFIMQFIGFHLPILEPLRYTFNKYILPADAPPPIGPVIQSCQEEKVSLKRDSKQTIELARFRNQSQFIPTP